MPDADALTPEWWVRRLYKRLVERRGEIDFYDAYYRGDHPLPWLAPQAREEFRRLVRMTRSNYTGLVPDTYAECVTIEGFRFGRDQTADEDTWRIWQANNLDSDSDQLILEALVTGQSYLLVAPNPRDGRTPFVWVEHPSQAIVEFAPGTNRRERAAGLKVWDDDWTGEVHATLYLPGWIYKFRAPRPASGNMPSNPFWERREVAGESWPAPNPLGVVPLVEMPNNPRLLTGGVSELSDITDIQDRINKTLFDRMQTQEFGVDPQKWAKGFPTEDAEGNPQTITFGRNRMVTTDVAEANFGNFAVAPLTPYSEAKREDVKDIAARKRIPADYLLGELNNVNGETLKASRAGLVSVTKQRRRSYAESLEDAMRLARRVAGLPGDGAGMETLFSNPEFRTEGELTDATIKKYQAGIVSRRQAREDLGYTAAQIARLEADDEAAASDPLLDRVARTLTGADAPADGG